MFVGDEGLPLYPYNSTTGKLHFCKNTLISKETFKDIWRILEAFTRFLEIKLRFLEPFWRLSG